MINSSKNPGPSSTQIHQRSSRLLPTLVVLRGVTGACEKTGSHGEGGEFWGGLVKVVLDEVQDTYIVTGLFVGLFITLGFGDIFNPRK